MIDNKLIFYKTLEAFNNDLGDGKISPTSIVFIKDAKVIWTHGTSFKASNADLDEYIKWYNKDKIDGDDNVSTLPEEIGLVTLPETSYQNLVRSGLVKNNIYYYTYQ